MDKTGHINKKTTFLVIGIVAALAVVATIFVKCSTGEAPHGFDPSDVPNDDQSE
jgi:hypothetical protein